MPKKKLNVAIVGLGFGAEFIPIYQSHPQANMDVGLCAHESVLAAGKIVKLPAWSI